MGKIRTELELKVPITKIWNAFHDSSFLPKAIPERFTAVEVLEGDGYSAGSVRKIIFVAGVPHGPFLKEKILSVDKDSYTIVTEQIEGALIGTVFSYTIITFKFSPVGDDKCKLHWEFEYESLVADPPLDQAKEGATQTIKKFETYLISSQEYS